MQMVGQLVHSASCGFLVPTQKEKKIFLRGRAKAAHQINNFNSL